ncbi:MAG: sortase [Chloroflexota bacterium]|nr:sortase [Chloroflexota bacterium]
MKTRTLKIAIFMLWGGSGLLLLGMLLSLPTFLATFAHTSEIATAPPLDTGALAMESTRTALGPVVEASQPEPSALLPATEETKPTPTTVPVGTPPRHIRIPSLHLDAPVVPVQWESTEAVEGAQSVWQVPDWKAVGWHEGSALLGLPGNTVLNGHNTTRGEIFRNLYKLEEGDLILVEGEDQRTYAYEVQHLYILEEAGQPLEVRLANARYVQLTTDERLTLVTCHPYGSLRYRLIVIGRPIPQPENDGISSTIEQ